MAIVSDDVVILARTQMKGNRVCVGGYSVTQKRYVRLLTKNAENQSETTPYQVGQVYSVNYENRTQLVLPHCEDVCVHESELKDEEIDFYKILETISSRDIHIRDLFNKLLQWENGSGFLIEQESLPSGSVIVVQLNHDLYLSKKDREYYYYIDNNLRETFKVKYVGIYDKSNVRKILAGTFLRFSLARWWDRDGQFQQKRAYLQLSAIY